jgi:hypothetical protein
MWPRMEHGRNTEKTQPGYARVSPNHTHQIRSCICGHALEHVRVLKESKKARRKSVVQCWLRRFSDSFIH